LIALADEDPDLAEAVPHGHRDRFHAAARADVMQLGPGLWSPPLLEPDPAAIGLLLLAGFVSTSLETSGRTTVEVLGPGDLLRPWVRGDPASLVGTQIEWCVHTPARLAVLDGDFARRVAPWPALFATLLHRSTLRARRSALQGAINAHPTVRERLLLTLWSHADRWGTVTRAGVRVPLRLRHQQLAGVVAAQRPSVSKALSDLRRGGFLEPLRGGWLLTSDPPADYMSLREQSLLAEDAGPLGAELASDAPRTHRPVTPAGRTAPFRLADRSEPATGRGPSSPAPPRASAPPSPRRWPGAG
jgi:CRP/FNR family cyclic AMP-dependent transcriptional regulator